MIVGLANIVFWVSPLFLSHNGCAVCLIHLPLSTLFTYSVIHLPLSIYKVNTVLGIWNAVQNKTEKESCPQRAIINHMNKIFSILNHFLKDFIYFSREGKGGRKGEKHQCVVASHAPPTGDLAHNPGVCPDQELNQWPFGSQASTESTEPHQPGPYSVS